MGKTIYVIACERNDFQGDIDRRQLLRTNDFNAVMREWNLLLTGATEVGFDEDEQCPFIYHEEASVTDSEEIDGRVYTSTWTPWHRYFIYTIEETEEDTEKEKEYFALLFKDAQDNIKALGLYETIEEARIGLAEGKENLLNDMCNANTMFSILYNDKDDFSIETSEGEFYHYYIDKTNVKKK